MLLEILTVVVVAVVTYVIYALKSANDYEDNSFDAFVRPPSADQGTDDSSSSTQIKNNYSWAYCLPGRQLLILYGTEYGTSKEIAQELFDRVKNLHVASDSYPWQPRIVNVKHFDRVDFSQESVLLVVLSTAGDGVAPADARKFVQWLSDADSSRILQHINYSLLALGDSSYLHFCRAGRNVDARLLELGAKQIVRRHDVDAEDRQVINEWFNSVLATLDTLHVEVKLDYLLCADDNDTFTGPSREQPFDSVMKVKYNLTKEIGYDDKETIHCEFDIDNSGITWTSGDALGIYPQNDLLTVDELLQLLKWSGSELINVPNWAYKPKPDTGVSVRDALLRYFDLKNVKPELLQLIRSYSPAGSGFTDQLDRLLKDGLYKTNTVLSQYLAERELGDIFEEFNQIAIKIPIDELLKQVKMLLPRYYSISSSPLQDSATLCVTAAVVRYSTRGRSRLGVTTTFLQDRLTVGHSCPVFISQNHDFRLPTNGVLPVIMIGPGTGIAPFRAFIQERIITKCTGLNLLYFGCRRKNQDFLYREELERWEAEGVLKLRTAFSRDNPHKVYVQDLLLADADSVWSLIHTESAHIYVCGDARQMASDVHKVLIKIVTECGKMSEAEALSYISGLESAGRYQKDVWVT